MNWKTDLKLADLETTTAIEVVCKRCGLSRYEIQEQLLNERPEFRHAYLDEVEYNLHCSNRFCHGGVRIAMQLGKKCITQPVPRNTASAIRLNVADGSLAD